ncbi:hypothetical protein [uncultured Methanobrevibacter sp.]|uniref:hypothetical protein n=1 Tax=uncultured Methanobrevibacter sp. TaxID=253161 RepID=UPI0025D782AE|nr:hypothetical protein [uncultured Methanobrevibacter sp.]
MSSSLNIKIIASSLILLASLPSLCSLPSRASSANVCCRSTCRTKPLNSDATAIQTAL